MDLHHVDKVFEKVVYSEKDIKDREFENCIFKGCVLSGSNLSNCTFINCTFSNCDLSMVKLLNSSLKEVLFQECKILGVDFSVCRDFMFRVDFQKCIVDFSSFNGKKMAKTMFRDCSLKSVNFTGSDLAEVDFGGSNLDGAIFRNTTLKGTDFTNAQQFRIDPELNRIKRARFNLYGLPGLLEKYEIQIE